MIIHWLALAVGLGSSCQNKRRMNKVPVPPSFGTTKVWNSAYMIPYNYRFGTYNCF